MKTVSLACLIFALSIPIAFAWGPEGHQTVAELASTMLTPEADGQIKIILGNDNLAAVATWSDEIRNAARGKGPLGLIDIQDCTKMENMVSGRDGQTI